MRDESFRLIHTDGSARLGELSTRHGVIETPVFMPVGTLASVKSLTTEQLKSLMPHASCPMPQIILNNTYHLMLRPGVDLIERLGGVHKFMSWDRAVLSDSGGFQVFSLAAIRKLSEEGVEFRSHIDGSAHFLSPERSIEIQQRLGVDIAMAFDECPPYGISHAETEKSMELTHRWARRSLAANGAPANGAPASAGPIPAKAGAPSLFGIVQGGVFHDLRKRSVEEICAMDFDGVAIGGVAVAASKSA